jgi:hypothetical protein
VTVQVVLYCRCGGSLKARVHRHGLMVQRLEQLWALDHATSRCAPTNAQGAANARLLERLRERNRWRRAA